MKTQEAISILMLSPCYWLMKIAERRELIKEFMASYAAVSMSCTGSLGNPGKQDKYLNEIR